MAGKRIQRIHGRIGAGEGTGAQQQGQMTPGRHGNRADPLRVEVPFPGLGPDQPHGPLPVFPGRLVHGKPLRPRRAVHQVHALEAQGGERLFPLGHRTDVAAVLVGAAGDEDHAGAVGMFRRCGCASGIFFSEGQSGWISWAIARLYPQRRMPRRKAFLFIPV